MTKVELVMIGDYVMIRGWLHEVIEILHQGDDDGRYCLGFIDQNGIEYHVDDLNDEMIYRKDESYACA